MAGRERIFIVEHEPVITLGRREESIRDLVTSPGSGDGTGGGLSWYTAIAVATSPITGRGRSWRIRSSDWPAYANIRLSGYVNKPESIIVATLAEIGITGEDRSGGGGGVVATGKWTRRSARSGCGSEREFRCMGLR